MGSRGNNNTFNAFNLLEDYQQHYITENNIIGGWGLKRNLTDFLLNNNHNQKDIDEMYRLIDRHASNHNIQMAADAEMVEHLNNNDAIGKILEDRIKFEESLFKNWSKFHKDGGVIYRKGELGKGVEAWTVNREGANMGYGGIGYDHTTTIKEMLGKGYHILGGLGTKTGASGEGEVTFIRYKKR